MIRVHFVPLRKGGDEAGSEMDKDRQRVDMIGVNRRRERSIKLLTQKNKETEHRLKREEHSRKGKKNGSVVNLFLKSGPFMASF